MALTKTPIELSSTPSIVDGGNATAITIDSSENVLVGKTALEYENTAGHIFRNDGFQSSIRSDGNVADFNRLSSSGEIIRFSKDGETVGNISVISGDRMLFATADGLGITLDKDNNRIVPSDATGGANSNVSLGSSGLEFKDLYLSGFVRAGEGTAADPVLTGSDGNTGLFFPSGGVTCFTQNGVESCRFDASGNLLVGTTSTNPTSGFRFLPLAGNSYAEISHGSGSPSGTSFAVFRYNQSIIGSIGQHGTSAVLYNTSSDYRLKEDAVPMTGATERVKALRPINFAWKVDGSRTDGFLAHEVQDVVPEAISGTKDAMRDEEYEVTPAVLDDDGNVTTEAVMGTRSVPDYQGIDQSKLVPLLVATIQELEARLTALENN